MGLTFAFGRRAGPPRVFIADPGLGADQFVARTTRVVEQAIEICGGIDISHFSFQYGGHSSAFNGCRRG